MDLGRDWSNVSSERPGSREGSARPREPRCRLPVHMCPALEPSPAERGDRKRTLAIWLAILGVAAVLRLGFLTQDSLWLDEVYSVRLASGHTAAEIWTGHLDDRHPPLFYVLLRGALTTAGTAEWTARLPSALASLLGVPLVFVLARNLGLTVRGAMTAALLLALAPLDLWYAREARMYALVAMAALVFAIGITWDSWRGVPDCGRRTDRGSVPGLHDRPAGGRADRARAVALVGARPAGGRPSSVWPFQCWRPRGCRALSGPLLLEAANGLHQVTFFRRLGEITNGSWPGGARHCGPSVRHRDRPRDRGSPHRAGTASRSRSGARGPRSCGSASRHRRSPSRCPAPIPPSRSS